MALAWLLPVLFLAGAPAIKDLPELKEGDLVFHESTSRQSALVRSATGSSWTHMGVIFRQDGELWVLEAVQPVKKTRLAAWIGRGTEGRVVIKRLRDADRILTAETKDRMRKLGMTWLGRNYDGRFLWDDDRLYCSELVYKLFERGAGVKIGTMQKAGEMHLADPKVQAEIRRRFKGAKFDPEEPVVTPQSMFDDPGLEVVFER